jgi:hypothetical protein
MEIKSRKQAIVDGDNIFYTGIPCANGHITYRYVQSGSCKDCINEPRNANFYKAKADTLRKKAEDILKEADRLETLGVEMNLKTKRDAVICASTAQQLREYADAKNKFVTFFEPVNLGEEPQAAEILLKYARKYSLLITERDVLHNVKPRLGNVRRMACHENDLQAVRAELTALRKAKPLEALPSILRNTETVVNPQYQEFGVKCAPDKLEVLISLVQYYATANYGSDVNLDEFKPTKQDGPVKDMYWIKCRVEDLPDIKAAVA